MMTTTKIASVDAELSPPYDREKELKEFDDSKTGVKGLVDSGVVNIPRIFHFGNSSPENLNNHKKHTSIIPTIDFGGTRDDETKRREVVKQVKEACETWGFFQAVGHGVPVTVVDGMLDSVRRFHELDESEKKRFYSRDVGSKFYYNSNFDLYRSKAANWRDTVTAVMAPRAAQPEELPQVFRDIIFEYSKHIMSFGQTLVEVLSEALGLHPNHLENMGCAEGLLVMGHYYPACPQPEFTFATSAHTDSGFFTVLAQDQVGGLQILHDDQWVDVHPLPGALVINIADLLQFITNDKFKSGKHRVLANTRGPRISVASFFRVHFDQHELMSKLVGPIKELISEKNPQMYVYTTLGEYLRHYYEKGAAEIPALSDYKFRNKREEGVKKNSLSG